MRKISMMILSASVLTLAACNNADTAAPAEGDAATTETAAADAPAAVPTVEPGGQTLSTADMPTEGQYPGAVAGPDASVWEIEGQPGKMKISIPYTFPASADAVLTWYADTLNKEGGSLTRSGNIVSGTAKGGEKVTINVVDQGEGKSAGVVTMEG